MKARSFITLLSCIGLLVAAAGTLYIVRWQNLHPYQTPLSSLTNPDSSEAVAAYMKKALAIHDSYKSSKITHEQFKIQAMALTVPAVLKTRHLEWVVAIDAGRDDAIDAMMREYRVLTSAQ